MGLRLRGVLFVKKVFSSNVKLILRDEEILKNKSYNLINQNYKPTSFYHKIWNSINPQIDW